MSKVSIIIPVYNAENTLTYCLESVFAQTYKDIELIFINDCSTDNSLEIISGFIKKHSSNSNFNCKIIHHKKNKGVAAARNTGLDHATGKYIYYIDSDDTIMPSALAVMIEVAEANDYDIVGCEWQLRFKENSRRMNQPDITSGVDAFLKMTGGILRWNLWLFLVKRSLYEENPFRFKEGMNMGEDMMMMGKLFLNAQSVHIIHEHFYNYYQTNQNSLTKDMSEKHILQVTENVKELERYVMIEKQLHYDKALHFLKLNIKLPLLTTGNPLNYQVWCNWFKESNDYIMQNKLLPLRTRLLQKMAAKKQFWIIDLYYNILFRFIYGFIYR